MHFEQLGFHVELPNKEPLPKAKKGHEYLVPQRITKAKLSSWIQQSGIHEEIKEELLKILSKSPVNTLDHFYKHIHNHIENIEKTRKQQKATKENSNNQEQ